MYQIRVTNHKLSYATRTSQDIISRNQLMHRHVSSIGTAEALKTLIRDHVLRI